VNNTDYAPAYAKAA
ncbi:tmRNA tag peptide, partial [Helicobacter pylori v225d]